jgi:hypothetical protein
MESKDDGTAKQDTPTRDDSGLLTGIFFFGVAYALFAHSYDQWGLALGWMPSTIIGAAFGWIAYCFPWIGDIRSIAGADYRRHRLNAGLRAVVVACGRPRSILLMVSVCARRSRERR